MQKVSLVLEDTLATVVFVIGIALALATLGVDEEFPRQRIYSSSFLKYPDSTPAVALRSPLECDATVTGRSPGELPRERCYVRKSKRSSK